MPPKRTAKKTAPLAQEENFDEDTDSKIVDDSESEKGKTMKKASKKGKVSRKDESDKNLTKT